MDERQLCIGAYERFPFAVFALFAEKQFDWLAFELNDCFGITQPKFAAMSCVSNHVPYMAKGIHNSLVLGLGLQKFIHPDQMYRLLFYSKYSVYETVTGKPTVHQYIIYNKSLLYCPFEYLYSAVNFDISPSFALSYENDSFVLCFLYCF